MKPSQMIGSLMRSSQLFDQRQVYEIGRWLDNLDGARPAVSSAAVASSTDKSIGLYVLIGAVAALVAYTADDESAAYTGAVDGEAKLADLNALRVAVENLRVMCEDLRSKIDASSLIY